MSTNRVPPSPVTDEALLARIAQRERQALEQLYDRHSARALGLVLQVEPDRARAEEIVLETFWYIWKHADKLKTAAPKIEVLLPTLIGWVASTPRDASHLSN